MLKSVSSFGKCGRPPLCSVAPAKKAGFTLCPDAKAWSKEARRRISVNREKKFTGVEEGDRILVMGEDENGNTDDLGSILIKVDSSLAESTGKHRIFQGSNCLAHFRRVMKQRKRAAVKEQLQRGSEPTDCCEQDGA